MNIQGINKYQKIAFSAKLRNSDELAKLTGYEVLEGRYGAYKEALKRLDDVHNGEVLDICQTSDGKSFIIVNQTTGNSDYTDYTENLTNTVNELARPTSRLHKHVFSCNGTSEVNQITKEFYA